VTDTSQRPTQWRWVCATCSADQFFRATPEQVATLKLAGPRCKSCRGAVGFEEIGTAGAAAPSELRRDRDRNAA
jgi:hypothetical protein